MPVNLHSCSQLLAEQGLRHHLDVEEEVIRVVQVTRSYRNARGERLLIVTVETPDAGERLHARIGFAFPPGEDPARVCLLTCRLAAAAPFVGVEFDADRDDLRLVAEMPVVDGTVTARQLSALIDGLVAAAEEWQVVIDAHPSMRSLSRRGRRIA